MDVIECLGRLDFSLISSLTGLVIRLTRIIKKIQTIRTIHQSDNAPTGINLRPLTLPLPFHV